ncbi:MAG: hypothetical protein AB2A00_29130 [Myxococcota bacterium]
MSNNELEPWDDDVSALLAAERNAPAPPGVVVERVWQRVALTAPAPVDAPSSPTEVLARSWRHTVVTALVSGGLGLTGGALLHAALAEPVVQVVTVERVVRVPERVEVPVPASPVVAPPAKAPVTQSTSTATPEPAPADAVALEAALLDRARTALSRDDAAGALQALGDHARRFPTGMFSEERDAVRVQALVRAGRMDEAQQAARVFLEQHPASLHRPRVEAVLHPR